MRRPQPKADSQCGRLLRELSASHWCPDPLRCTNELCGRVPLPQLLDLHISQYSARVWELRHKFGYVIDNGPDPNNSDHTWVRLAGRRDEIAAVQPSEESPTPSSAPASLFGNLPPDRSYAE